MRVSAMGAADAASHNTRQLKWNACTRVDAASRLRPRRGRKYILEVPSLGKYNSVSNMVERPTRHIIGRFGYDLCHQSLDCFNFQSRF